jgi:integrase/recombinase XerD
MFKTFLQTEFDVTEISKVQSGHIRQYIKYLKERGKYTVVNDDRSREVNHPENRKDYKKQISPSTIATYLRNIKVFFNVS